MTEPAYDFSYDNLLRMYQVHRGASWAHDARWEEATRGEWTHVPNKMFRSWVEDKTLPAAAVEMSAAIQFFEGYCSAALEEGLRKRRARVVGIEMFNKAFLDLPGDNVALLFDPSVKLTDIEVGDLILGLPKEETMSNEDEVDLDNIELSSSAAAKDLRDAIMRKDRGRIYQLLCHEAENLTKKQARWATDMLIAKQQVKAMSLVAIAKQQVEPWKPDGPQTPFYLVRIGTTVFLSKAYKGRHDDQPYFYLDGEHYTLDLVEELLEIRFAF